MEYGKKSRVIKRDLETKLSGIILLDAFAAVLWLRRISCVLYVECRSDIRLHGELDAANQAIFASSRQDRDRFV